MKNKEPKESAKTAGITVLAERKSSAMDMSPTIMMARFPVTRPECARSDRLDEQPDGQGDTDADNDDAEHFLVYPMKRP